MTKASSRVSSIHCSCVVEVRNKVKLARLVKPESREKSNREKRRETDRKKDRANILGQKAQKRDITSCLAGQTAEKDNHDLEHLGHIPLGLVNFVKRGEGPTRRKQRIHQLSSCQEHFNYDNTHSHQLQVIEKERQVSYSSSHSRRNRGYRQLSTTECKKRGSY